MKHWQMSMGMCVVAGMLAGCAAVEVSTVPNAAETTEEQMASQANTVADSVRSNEKANPGAEVEFEEKRARLFVLRWNPGISSFTEERFQEGMRLLNRRESDALGFDWSIWEHEAVRPGDWWVMLRVGTDADGVVGAGVFTSSCHPGLSWRGDGKQIWYADMAILWFQDPSRSGLLRAEALEPDFPELEWHGGHAGVVVPADTAERLTERIVRELARLKRYNSRSLAVRRLHGGVRSALGAMVADLCPGWMTAARQAGRLANGRSAWVDLKAIRAGKAAGECLRGAEEER